MRLKFVDMFGDIECWHKGDIVFWIEDGHFCSWESHEFHIMGKLFQNYSGDQVKIIDSENFGKLVTTAALL